MTNIDTKVTSKKVKIEHQIAQINIYIDICIYDVELKIGPIFAFSSVKNWSFFF